MIHIGFTGTRHGMTVGQQIAVQEILHDLYRRRGQLVGHHGDCVGADAQFHNFVRRFIGSVVGHPPIVASHRAFCHFDESREPLNHLARNRAIVDESEVMIATPFEDTHQVRGGTWYTYDYTLKAKKPIALVIPSGQIFYEGAPWPM